MPIPDVLWKRYRDRESELTGIPSLKIAFNNVFGYYIEVRNTHKDKVPETWIRKQTLVSAERYITPELKEYEEKIVGAEEKISAIENRLFAELVQGALTFIPRIQRNAIATATVDCLLSMARTAEEYRYVRPVVDDSLKISITEGPSGNRTPSSSGRAIHQQQCGTRFRWSSDSYDNHFNMSGKSALLRRAALIVLLAQIGSFVPAEAAHIGLSG